MKITEDFVSYDFLRYRTKIFTFIWDIMMFSMIAEIGGYSGLLIGFSLMDIALLFQYFVDKLSEMKHV